MAKPRAHTGMPPRDASVPLRKGRYSARRHRPRSFSSQCEKPHIGHASVKGGTAVQIIEAVQALEVLSIRICFITNCSYRILPYSLAHSLILFNSLFSVHVCVETALLQHDRQTSAEKIKVNGPRRKMSLFSAGFCAARKASARRGCGCKMSRSSSVHRRYAQSGWPLLKRTFTFSLQTPSETYLFN